MVRWLGAFVVGEGRVRVRLVEERVRFALGEGQVRFAVGKRLVRFAMGEGRMRFVMKEGRVYAKFGGREGLEQTRLGGWVEVGSGVGRVGTRSRVGSASELGKGPVVRRLGLGFPDLIRMVRIGAMRD